MIPRKYLALSGLIFFAVAIVHALRATYGWEVVIGGFSVPMWASWAGFLVAGSLSWAAFRHLRR